MRAIDSHRQHAHSLTPGEHVIGLLIRTNDAAQTDCCDYRRCQPPTTRRLASKRSARGGGAVTQTTALDMPAGTNHVGLFSIFFFLLISPTVLPPYRPVLVPVELLYRRAAVLCHCTLCWIIGPVNPQWSRNALHCCTSFKCQARITIPQEFLPPNKK